LILEAGSLTGLDMLSLQIISRAINPTRPRLSHNRDRRETE